MIHKKVEFQGKVYWLHTGYMGFNLSPLSHYDENGNLLNDGLTSYAIVVNGEIFRFGEVIGKMEDLVEITS